MNNPSSRPPRADAPTRERLLHIALRRFRLKGFDAVSVSEITREAGVAKGTFFNYFPTKEHLLAESFRHVVDDALEELFGRDLAGTEAILRFAGSLARGLSGDPVVQRAVGLRWGGLPPVTEGDPREEERIRRWIRERLGEALPLRVPLVEADPTAFSFHLVWALRGSVEAWAREEGSGDALEEAIGERMRFLLTSAGLPV